MKISKKTLNLLVMNIMIVPLLGNLSFFKIYNLELLPRILLLVMPALYFLGFFYDFILNKYYKKKGVFLNPLIISLAFFLLLLIISLFSSINIDVYNFSNLLNFIYICLFIYSLYIYEFSEKDKKLITRSLFLIFALVVSIAVVQYVFDLDMIKYSSANYPGSKGRVNSTFYIATLLDKYISVMLIILFSFLAKKDLTKLNKLGLLILISIGALALIFTFTRIGILVYYVTSFIFFLLFLKRKKIVEAIFTILLWLSLFLIPGYKHVLFSIMYTVNDAADSALYAVELNDVVNYKNNLVNSIISKVDFFNDSDNVMDNIMGDPSDDIISDDDIDFIIIDIPESAITSQESRNYFQNIAKHITKEYPYTGIGIGSYNYVYKNQNINSYLSNYTAEAEYMYPHNMFYHLSAETGIISVFVLLFIIFYVLLIGVRKENIFLSAFLLFTFILFCCFEGILYSKAFAYIYIIIIMFFSKNQIKNIK